MIKKLMLGTAQFGLNYGIANKGGQINSQEVVKILDYAANNSITSIDTAAAYGNSEEILGNALNILKNRDYFYIVSKIKPIPENISENQVETFIEKSLHQSLKNLKSDYLDGCLFHRENDIKHLHLLEKYKSKGMIKNFGVSVDSKNINDNFTCDLIQAPLNICDMRFENILKSNKYKIFTRSAYLQGALLMDKFPSHLGKLAPTVQKFKKIAQKYEIDWAKLCFCYPLNREEVSKIVFGIDNLSQLKYNITLAQNGKLPSELLQEIEQNRELLPESLIKPSNWSK